MNHQGLAVATALMLSAGMVSAAGPAWHADGGANVAMPSRSAPTDGDSFADVVAGGSMRNWAVVPPAAPQPGGVAVNDPFDGADPARRTIDRPSAPPPAGGEMSFDADAEGLIPVPEPGITTLLLAGLGAIGLLSLRRKLQ